MIYKNYLNKLFLFIISSVCYAQVYLNSPQDAAEFAVQNSNSYKLNMLSLETAFKSSKLAIQDFLPKFDFSWSEDDSVKTGGSDSRSKTISVSVNQFVFDGGKNKITYDMNKAESYYNIKNFEQELDTFRSSAINQYYVCIQLQKEADIKSELENNALAQLEILKKEYELGITLENDYLEYLISYRKIQDETKQKRRELRTEYRKFKVLLGLEPKAELIISEPKECDEDIPYLEGYTERLWQMLKSNSPGVKKSVTALYYTRQKYLYSKRVYYPEVSFEGGISFSGTEYPLNNPSYNAKVVISFSNNPLFPLAVSNGYGFNNKQLTSVSNSSSVSVSPQPGYYSSLSANRISLKAQEQSLKDEENELYETLFEKIASYDDNVDNVLRTKETISLQERRLVVSKEQVEKGEMKRIDYLDELTELSEQKISLLQSETQQHSIVRDLEISLCIPFGGLKKCLLQN